MKQTDQTTEGVPIVREDAGPLKGGTVMIIALFPLFLIIIAFSLMYAFY